MSAANDPGTFTLKTWHTTASLKAKDYPDPRSHPAYQFLKDNSSIHHVDLSGCNLLEFLSLAVIHASIWNIDREEEKKIEEEKKKEKKETADDNMPALKNLSLQGAYFGKVHVDGVDNFWDLPKQMALLPSPLDRLLKILHIAALKIDTVSPALRVCEELERSLFPDIGVKETPKTKASINTSTASFVPRVLDSHAIMIKKSSTDSSLHVLAEASMMTLFGFHENVMGCMGIFEKEIRVPDSLSDPKSFQIHRTWCMVLDRMEGDLNSLRLDSMALETKLDVAIQIASALRYLHRAGVMHLSLKPGNILWRRTESGKYCVKLSDFGNFMTLKDSSYVLQNRRPYNEYFPPEIRGVLLGNQERIKWSTKVDVWSFGMILYQLLKGKTKEFQAMSTWHFSYWDYATSVLYRPPAISLTFDCIPGKLEAIIRSCLEWDTRRPTMEKVLEELRACPTEI